MKKLFLILPLLISAVFVSAQFGQRNTIFSSGYATFKVVEYDYDNDGDNDILRADDNDIILLENIGGGTFNPESVVLWYGGGIPGIRVEFIDLDNDNDLDVLACNRGLNEIAWFENLGNLTMGPKQIISLSQSDPVAVTAFDMDGDGDNDIITASDGFDLVVWFENLGGSSYSTPNLLSSSLNCGGNAFAQVSSADLDNDGDLDIVFGSNLEDGVWFENLGGGSYSTEQIIYSYFSYAKTSALLIEDFDQDGDLDILSGHENAGLILHKNDGNGNFNNHLILDGSGQWISSLFAGDLDGDLDLDIVYPTAYTAELFWIENLGSATYSAKKLIDINVTYGNSTTMVKVCASDLDGDSDLEILAFGNQATWYENYIIGPPCNLSPNFTRIDNGNGNYSFTNTSVGSYDQSHWAFGDGNTSTITSPNHTFSADGTFVVVLTINDTTYESSCVDYYLDTINVTGVPIPLQCNAGFVFYPDAATGNITVVNSSTGTNLTYLWSFGDGDTSTLQFPNHTYATAGPFYLCLTIDDGAGCVDMYCDSIGENGVVFNKAAGFTINVIAPPVITGLENNLELNSLVKIYPNPNTGLFTIEKTYGFNKEVGVRLLDVTSKLILDKLIPIGKQKIEIDITNYGKGIYYLQLIVEDEIFVKQIIKG
ncbi:MAG: VCBS repeat-containing protein [Bacteroidetes bacterium]|nr:VCBS repeat-containing protein [Bacteroidota bacterium]